VSGGVDHLCEGGVSESWGSDDSCVVWGNDGMTGRVGNWMGGSSGVGDSSWVRLDDRVARESMRRLDNLAGVCDWGSSIGQMVWGDDSGGVGRDSSGVDESSLLPSGAGLSFSNSGKVLGFGSLDFGGVDGSVDGDLWGDWESVGSYSVSIVVSDVVGGQSLTFGGDVRERSTNSTIGIADSSMSLAWFRVTP